MNMFIMKLAAEHRFPAQSSACLALRHVRYWCVFFSEQHLRTQHVALLIPRHTESLGKGSPPGWNMGSSCWWACRTLQLLVCLLAVPWLHRNCLPDHQGWSQEGILPLHLITKAASFICCNSRLGLPPGCVHNHPPCCCWDLICRHGSWPLLM